MYGKLVIHNTDEIRLELRQSGQSNQIELYAIQKDEEVRIMTIDRHTWGKWRITIEQPADKNDQIEVRITSTKVQEEEEQ